MFRTIALAAAVSILATPAIAAAGPAERAAGQAGQPASAAGGAADPTKDAQFLAMAHQDGQKEIALANLAASKAKNPQVKALAEKIRADHQAAGQEIQKLAAGKKLTLPSQATDQQAEVAKLQKLSGDNFDREYARMMVAEHEKAIEAFSDAAASADGDVKAFAEKTLPALQEHLQQAQALQGGAQAAK